MYSTTEVSKEIVDALYRRAERLERQWIAAGLAVDFPDRMLDAVFRFIGRNALKALTPRQAEGLLRSFWTLNARRDAVRARFKPEMISLSDCEVAVTKVDPLESWSSAGLIEGCRRILASHGIRPEVCEAFLQDILGNELDKIASPLGARFENAPSPQVLRQWRHRYFTRAYEILRANSSIFGLETGPCHASESSTALEDQWRSGTIKSVAKEVISLQLMEVTS
jgi:hypothetical protein